MRTRILQHDGRAAHRRPRPARAGPRGRAALLCVVVALGAAPAAGVVASPEDARAIVARIEAAVERVTAYDLRYTVRFCREIHPGLISADGAFPEAASPRRLTERFEDRYSQQQGRRVRWVNSRWEMNGEAMRRLDGREWRLRPTVLERLGPGHDYLSYLYPRIGTSDGLATLKAHPDLRVREAPERPNQVAVEIPAGALAELDEMGCRVWADKARGLLPVQVDTYVAIGGQEVLLARMDIRVDEVAPGLRVPVGGRYAALRHPPASATARGGYETAELEVERPSSRWNPILSTADLAIAPRSPGAVAVSWGGLPGWEESAASPPAPPRPSRGRHYIIIGLANGLLVLVLVGWGYIASRSARAKRREGG